MMSMRTAECVSPKHPDKLCDIISDSILDMYLRKYPNARCAIETCGGHSKIFITGEVTSLVKVEESDIKKMVHDLTDIDDITIHLNFQSPEIAKGVDMGGAGDQGIMIGYACRENEEYIPQEYYLARKLNQFVYSKVPFDGKTQVTIVSDNELIVVCSFQHASSTELRMIVDEFFENYPQYTSVFTHINPAGDWEIGSFKADAGLTGRKIVVDSYGPRVPVGGGAFSGKDATKVDRSGAYMARLIAVEYLEQNPDAKEVVTQLSYAIGYNKPLQSTVTIDGVEQQIEGYNLEPKEIIKYLDLQKPIFAKTAEYGHFGREFKWK